jgi:hypothetical protein
LRKSWVVNLYVEAAWYDKKHGDLTGAHWFVRLYLPSGLKALKSPDSAIMAAGAAADAPEVANITIGTEVIPKALMPATRSGCSAPT